MQEVVRSILEAYFDPQFSDRSHGFRPGRGCHSAFQEIKRAWRGTTWFIEGDIVGCFDNLDHEVLLDILRENIHDGRFINLIGGLLKAGYLDEWRCHRTLSGSPLGGVVSPILANIYLDRFDQWVERDLIPDYTRGAQRRRNPAYTAIVRERRRAQAAGDEARVRTLTKEMRTHPHSDPNDQGYRRLKYVRYADDFILGFAGPRTEAKEIKRRIGEFLRDTLKLELSEEKTSITHGRTETARFLGYEVTVLQDDQKRTRRADGRYMRVLPGQIGLKVLQKVVLERCGEYTSHGKPVAKPEQLNNDAYSIVVQYESEYRGDVNYYRMAFNLHRFGRLKWIMEQSLTKTLANKLKVSVPEVYRRYQVREVTENGPRTTLTVVVPREGKKPLVARWGTTNLVWDANASWLDDDPGVVRAGRTEIVERLLADTCELCGSQEIIQVHHIKTLKTLSKPGR